MTTGISASTTLAAATDTVVYLVPTATLATINIAVTNRGIANAEVNIAIAPDDTPGAEDYIEYGVIIPPKGILERTAVVAVAGENVIVRASTADCTVRVHGFKEVAL